MKQLLTMPLQITPPNAPAVPLDSTGQALGHPLFEGIEQPNSIEYSRLV